MTVRDGATHQPAARARALEARAPLPAGGTVPNAADAWFVSSQRANASVSAGDQEVNEFDPGVSLLPRL
jgi:hypothetical protein